MSLLNNLRISTKIVSAFAVIMAVVAAVSATTYVQVAFIQGASVETAFAHDVVGAIDKIEKSLAGQESALRAFLLTGQNGFLAAYEDEGARYEQTFAATRGLLAESPDQQARLERLAEAVTAWHDEVTEVQIAKMRDPGTVEEARAIEVSGLGGELMGQVHVIASELRGAEEEVLAQRSAAQAGAFRSTTVALLAGAAAALVLSLAMGLLLARGIGGPVRAMTAAMRRLAEGDTNVAIPAVGRKDEVGAMAGAVQVFKDNAIAMERMRAEQAEAECRAGEEKRAAMQALAARFEESVGTIVDAVSSAAGQLEAAAQTLSGSSERTHAQSTLVASAATEASTNVQTVAAASEELAASIREIGQQVSKSSQIANNAVGGAERSSATAMTLVTTTEKIDEIVTLISNIASQTNLLALNATIEAARAGEAGKGFAVVASEVKSLASQTAKATEEISAQIAAIQDVSERTVQSIGEIAQVIGESREIAAGIAAAVEEQNAATAEIARNVQQAAQGTGEVTTAIVHVTEASAEAGSAAAQVLASARELAGTAKTLRGQVTSFLDGIRAA